MFVVIFLHNLYHKTTIRFGFCDILNNQGLGKYYQPQPRLNFKTSRVSVYKCFTSPLKIERKFFVFVAILEKGGAMHCKETITVLEFLS